ncbi:MAG: GDSL-type esterase/lipase family protein [Kiritimatiellae bacterium]|nr:GDSL-type esterase/lipase family protein [Kiritimatiellia bacterium]
MQKTSSLRTGSVALLDFLFLCSIIALPLAWYVDPLQITWGPLHTTLNWNWKPIVISLVLLIVRLAVAGKTPRCGILQFAIVKKLLASWIITWGFFMGIEGLLALKHVEPEITAPIVIRGQEDKDTKLKEGDEKVVLDPELLFRFKKGVMWDGIQINSLGFRDNDFPAEKPAGTVRVINMGDSCTAQGHPPYSTVLNRLLQETAPTDEPWHSFNTGVYGFSSMQGLRLFQKTVSHFQPDVVTLYFGWNDHWLYPVPDHARMAIRVSPVRAALLKGIKKKRVYGMLVRAARSEHVTEEEKPVDDLVNRVPPSVYESTLKEFIRDIRGIGALPILITAPGRHLSDSLVRRRFIRSTDEAERVHQEYVEITRKVAKETDTPLLDLAAIMAGSEYDDLFSGDGIHFQQPGTEFIASQIHTKLMELGKEGYFAKLNSNSAPR